MTLRQLQYSLGCGEGAMMLAASHDINYEAMRERVETGNRVAD